MNILIITMLEPNPQIGGLERIIFSLAQQLKRRKYQIYFATLKKSEFSKDFSFNFETIYLDNENQIDSLENVNQLKNYAKQKRIDCILNPSAMSVSLTNLGYKVCNELNIPLISQLHNTPSIYKYGFSTKKISFLFHHIKVLKSFFAYKKVFLNALYKSDKFILLSSRYEKELYKIVGQEWREKVCSIPNFIPFNVEKNLEEKEKVILFVGRMDYIQKRPDRVIKIWKSIYAKYPEWKLKFLGDGPYKSVLEFYITKHNIKNVEILGFCDPVKEYKKAEIICMTSQFEGLPMVLLEATAFGCIPLSFNSFESVYDIIDNNVDGYIIKAFNLVDYQKKLCYLMNNENERKKIRFKTEEIYKKFEVDFIVNNWIKLFEELTTEGK